MKTNNVAKKKPEPKFRKTEISPNLRQKSTIFSIDIQGRIVGGEKAPRPYPYQISLQVKVTKTVFGFFSTGRKEFMHNCGGSIVTKNCVVTAAHCVVDYKPEELSILAGTNKLRAPAPNGERYFIDKITVHPEYEELVTSDIAVLKINGTFNYGDKIAPIKYSDKFYGPDVNCTLSGYV